MSSPMFITLTGLNGSLIRVNAAQIIYYGTGVSDSRKSTYVETTSANIDGSDLWVTETPEQIDAMLGVTEASISDVRNAIAHALERESARLREEARSLQGVIERGDDMRIKSFRSTSFYQAFEFVRCLSDAEVRAALSAATGTGEA